MSGASLTELSAVELSHQVQSGNLSAVEVVQAHLSRIEAVNPAVNAVQDLRPEEALQQAARLDSAPHEQRAALPLAGLPTAVKDLTPAAGFRFTQGSPVFAERIAEEDALIVSRMRAAGAVIVGKTNAPEFGLGSHTFNPVYGATRNPFDLKRSAGGSSGGAAAALAARMLPIADGSDTGGSLRNPASFCNVVGLRPSLGRVPNITSSSPHSTLSVQGPMARSVRDTALLMSVLVGEDLRDPFSADADAAPYLAISRTNPHEAPPGAPTRPRAAWTPDFSGMLPVEQEVLNVLEPVVARLAAEGWVVEADHPDLRGAADAFRTLRGLQMLAALGPVAEQHAERMKSDALWNINVGRDVTGEDAARAQRLQGQAFRRTAELLSDYDVLITPTCQAAPFPTEHRYPRTINGVQMRDYLEWMTLPSIITVTNHPAISIPVGFTPSGLPVGLQVVGRFRREAELLAVAARVEDLCGTGDAVPQLDLDTTYEKFPVIE